jgi:hypothetical protein
MTADARVRVSLSTGELEIEGPETFIAQYDSHVQEILKRLADPTAITFEPSPNDQAGTSAATSAATPSDLSNGFPEFGEMVHRLPKGTTGTDQILVAGYYVSRRRADRTFPTAEASRLLIEQGIKLPNASQSVKNNIVAKRVFKTGKVFKLSRDGLERVGQLLGLPGPAS